MNIKIHEILSYSRIYWIVRFTKWSGLLFNFNVITLSQNFNSSWFLPISLKILWSIMYVFVPNKKFQHHGMFVLQIYCPLNYLFKLNFSNKCLSKLRFGALLHFLLIKGALEFLTFSLFRKKKNFSPFF